MATDTHSEYVIRIADSSGYANAPEYYAARTMPAFSIRASGTHSASTLRIFCCYS